MILSDLADTTIPKVSHTMTPASRSDNRLTISQTLPPRITAHQPSHGYIFIEIPHPSEPKYTISGLFSLPCSYSPRCPYINPSSSLLDLIEGLVRATTLKLRLSCRILEPQQDSVESEVPA